MIGMMKPNIGVATPEQFVNSCFVQVGLTPCIDPFIPHYLQDWGYKLMSNKKKNERAIEEFNGFVKAR